MADKLTLGELISALSCALDMTEGQPPGHCMRCCWIGVQLGRKLALPALQQRELYYMLLLKDLGCSSNAARICQLYATDDLSFKRDYKTVDGSLQKVLNFVLTHTGVDKRLGERFSTVINILGNGEQLAKELTQTRCERGAGIARQLRFGEAVADGIFALDEHWDGGGKPMGISGDRIPLYSRVALLAQVVDVFNTETGPEAAVAEVRRRKGRWFDPQLAALFEQLAAEPAFWQGLNAPDLAEQLLALEPAAREVALDDDYIDEIAAAFGQVVDAKSPYTAGHSERVALYTDMLSEKLELDEPRRRWLKRAALLHDVGKLGISNSILDKPDRLTDEEFDAVKQHAAFTEQILSRIRAFEELAQVAGAHHERPDGRGYPKGLAGDEISLETRIITTADIFDAITAERPYRGPIPVPRALEMMAEQLGNQIDEGCFEALQQVVAELDLERF